MTLSRIRASGRRVITFYAIWPVVKNLRILLFP